MTKETPIVWRSDYANVGVALRAMQGQKNAASESSRRAGSSWAGTQSFEDAVHLLCTGWPEGAARARTLVERMTAHVLPCIRRDEIHYDVDGAYFDAARVACGEPESWINFETREGVAGTDTAGQYVDVLVSLSIAHSVSTDVIQRRGAAIAACVACLEYAGYSTRVTVLSSTADNFETPKACMRTSIVVKDYNEPVHEEIIAFGVAHPSMLRRILFATKELAPSTVREQFSIDPQGTYGYPQDLAEDAAPAPHKVYLGRLTPSDPVTLAPFESDAQCETWLIETLQAQGVRLDINK